MPEPFLVIDKVTKVYHPGTSGQVMALDHLSWQCQRGDFVSIVGGNAAGKSTLLNIIAGSLKPTSGTISLQRRQLTTLPEYKKAVYISRVRQNPNESVILSLTLAENLAMAKLKTQSVGLRRGVKKHWRQEFITLLQPFGLGLERRLDDKIDLLSGGQKQIVALLMATMSNPKLLLLDEHAAALDPKMSRLVLEITNNLVATHHITTLMITHNISHALQYGNHLLLMQAGKIQFMATDKEKKNLTLTDLLAKIEGSSLEKNTLVTMSAEA